MTIWKYSVTYVRLKASTWSTLEFSLTNKNDKSYFFECARRHLFIHKISCHCQSLNQWAWSIPILKLSAELFALTKPLIEMGHMRAPALYRIRHRAEFFLGKMNPLSSRSPVCLMCIWSELWTKIEGISFEETHKPIQIYLKNLLKVKINERYMFESTNSGRLSKIVIVILSFETTMKTSFKMM